VQSFDKDRQLALVLASKIPDPTTGGGDYTVVGMVRGLLELGYEVVIIATSQIAIESQEIKSLKKRFNQRLSCKEDIARLATSKWFSILDRVSKRCLKKWVIRRICYSFYKVDIAFAYHFPSVNLLSEFGRHIAGPTVAILGDPPHLPGVYRDLATIYDGNIEDFQECYRRFCLSKYGANILSSSKSGIDGVDYFFACANHHVDDYVSLFGRRVSYTRTPIWRENLENCVSIPKNLNPSKINVLHIGHLSGTATSNGVAGLLHGLARAKSGSLDEVVLHLVGVALIN